MKGKRKMERVIKIKAEKDRVMKCAWSLWRDGKNGIKSFGEAVKFAWHEEMKYIGYWNSGAVFHAAKYGLSLCQMVKGQTGPLDTPFIGKIEGFYMGSGELAVGVENDNGALCLYDPEYLQPI